MTNRARELLVCDRLAHAINERTGSDYKAILGDDPPDGVLTSLGGTRRPLPVEIVSAPIHTATAQLVDDQRDDLLRAEKRITAALREAGHTDLHLAAHLQRGVPPAKLDPKQIDRLVAFAATCPEQGSAHLHDWELFEYDEFLSRHLITVSVYRFEGIGGPFASIPLSAWIPGDGTWIQGAVDKKVATYEPSFASTLILAVDTALLVHQDQIAAFVEHCRTARYPFREIWVVPRAGQPVRACVSGTSD